MENDARENRRKRLQGLEAYLLSKIRGQEHVVRPVCRILHRGEMGLTNPKRPKGSFLFVGPSGVGKTELTNEFNEYLFPEHEVIRFDCSEFQLQDSVAVLIGRNVDEEGRFGKAMEGRTEGVVLFDEVEKAHPLVLDLLLQILDAGRLTLASNRRLDFRKFYVVLTSNIGAGDAMKMRKSRDGSFQKAILNKVRENLRPEFIFRINMKIVFRALEVEVQEAIADDMIRLALTRMRSLGYDLKMSTAGRLLIIEHGIDRDSGARPLRGVTEDYIEGAIAEADLEGKPTNGVLVPSEDRDKLVIVPARPDISTLDL